MRNELASEVLDRNMLLLMNTYRDTLEEPGLLNSTIMFLEHTSQLIDIFWDRNRPIRTMQDARLTKILQVAQFFKDWEEKETNPNSLLTAETREDIQSSLHGFLAVVEKLVPKNIPINPGYFNSDIVENFFCQQRGIRHGLTTNPTISQYGPAINAILLGQATVSRKSNAGRQAARPYTFSKAAPLNKRTSKKRP